MIVIAGFGKPIQSLSSHRDFLGFGIVAYPQRGGLMKRFGRSESSAKTLFKKLLAMQDPTIP
jgi:hypothetical protein